MGAFSDLMLEAKGRGAQALAFVVDLGGYTGEPDRERWTCSAEHQTYPTTARGRSGEEALRNVVDALKRNEGT